MKCKFMPIVETNLRQLGIVAHPIIRAEYAECLEDRCPYFGIVRRYYSHALRRWLEYTEPVCRRADHG